MSEKKKPKTGSVTDYPVRLAFCPADFHEEKRRAEAWKAMAERLYKAALCDCCEHGGTACHRCLSTIQAYTNLEAKEKGAS